MASVFYGLNNLATQQNQENVTEGSSTQSTDVEVRIDTTKSWNRQGLYNALDAISKRIVNGYDDLGVQ